MTRFVGRLLGLRRDRGDERAALAWRVRAHADLLWQDHKDARRHDAEASAALSDAAAATHAAARRLEERR